MIDWAKPIEYVFSDHVYPARVICNDLKGDSNIVVAVNYDGKEVIYFGGNSQLRNKESEKKYVWINIFRELNQTRFYTTTYRTPQAAQEGYITSNHEAQYIDIARKVEIQ